MDVCFNCSRIESCTMCCECCNIICYSCINTVNLVFGDLIELPYCYCCIKSDIVNKFLVYDIQCMKFIQKCSDDHLNCSYLYLPTKYNQLHLPKSHLNILKKIMDIPDK